MNDYSGTFLRGRGSIETIACDIKNGEEAIRRLIKGREKIDTG
jgi:hypothetical protein